MTEPDYNRLQKCVRDGVKWAALDILIWLIAASVIISLALYVWKRYKLAGLW